jgi:uncharacterized MAPEG superfamily protein
VHVQTWPQIFQIFPDFPRAACFLGYIAWTFLLSLGLAAARFAAMASEGRLANSFVADGTDLKPFGHRVTRAQGNSLEWLAIPAALLLYAIATGQTALTDTMAPLALGARVAQSGMHLISTSPRAVLLRGSFLGTQLGIWVFWTIRFAAAG